jgi:23S rRNA pseudouridine2604 synthase
MADSQSPVGSNEPDGKVRVSKLMSERGLCSRREADSFIERGLVYVDGVRVTELGTRIDPASEITLARPATDEQRARVTLLLHKPIGYVSGQAEDGHQPASLLLTEANRWVAARSSQRWSPSHLRGLAPAGRLDIDSTGLIVFTQDGRVAKELIGENSRIEKEYLVRVEGRLSREGLALLNFGLALDGEPLKPAKVSWQNEDQLRFVLRQGKKRQIRRMCELVGLKVTGLKRVRVGSVLLGALPVGKWRYLQPDEHFGSPGRSGTKNFAPRGVVPGTVQGRREGATKSPASTPRGRR